MRVWLHKFTNSVKSLSVRQKILLYIVFGLVIIFILYQFNWSGFGIDSNKSVTTKEVINPKDGKIIKLTETTENFQSAKTIWDWLQLAGVIAIPIVLFQFENREQKKAERQANLEKEQAEQQAKLEKEIADNNQREEILQAYIDRISELLIDKKLKQLFYIKLETKNPDYLLLDAALDIIRARTLSVLRRLDKDRERIKIFLNFLIDVELINEPILIKANLESIDIEYANLEGANFEGTNLKDAKLEGVNLKGANLQNANLEGANLKGANLQNANLEGANLQNANLNYAELKGADLNSAVFILTELTCTNFKGASLQKTYLLNAYFKDVNLQDVNLEDSNLEGAILQNVCLEGAILKGVNLECANLIRTNLKSANLEGVYLESATFSSVNLENIIWDKNTVWDNIQGFETAKNVPEELKNILGIS